MGADFGQAYECAPARFPGLKLVPCTGGPHWPGSGLALMVGSVVARSSHWAFFLPSKGSNYMYARPSCISDPES